MRCKTCDYSLKGLTEHRCPECGNPFDPNDPRTVARPCGLTIKHILLVFVAFYLGFAVLGGLLDGAFDVSILVPAAVLAGVATFLMYPVLMVAFSSGPKSDDRD